MINSIQFAIIVLVVIHSQLDSGLLREHGAVPLGFEGEVDGAFGDARNGFNALLDLCQDLVGHGAVGGGEGHKDGHFVLFVNGEFVY